MTAHTNGANTVTEDEFLKSMITLVYSTDGILSDHLLDLIFLFFFKLKYSWFMLLWWLSG